MIDQQQQQQQQQQQAGGKPRSVSQWVSANRETTCKDGVRRTVFRNKTSGALAVKRVYERKGKRIVRYVKLAAQKGRSAAA